MGVAIIEIHFKCATSTRNFGAEDDYLKLTVDLKNLTIVKVI